MPDEVPEKRLFQPLSIDDFDMIYEAVTTRAKNFPDEPPAFTLALVISNIGDRFTKVKCLGEEEWTGRKMDIPKGDGLPTCPNGHSLLELGPKMTIGWVSLFS